MVLKLRQEWKWAGGRSTEVDGGQQENEWTYFALADTIGKNPAQKTSGAARHARF